jgi:ATP-dependent DNA helicase HFM1/MER3
VKPRVAPSWFPTPKPPDVAAPSQQPQPQRPTSNMSVRRIENTSAKRTLSGGTDSFDDDGIDDDELVQAALEHHDFDHIENYSDPIEAIARKNTSKNIKAKGKGVAKPSEKVDEEDDNEPTQLENGKWACNHKCKDKHLCKHLCCREGTEKPPRKPAMKKSNEPPHQTSTKVTSEKGKKVQTTLQLTASKRKTSAAIEELDMTQQEKKRKAEFARSGPLEYRNLQQLHKNILRKVPHSSISSIVHKKPAYHYGTGGDYNLSFMEQDPETRNSTSDYGDIELEGLESHFDRLESSRTQGKSNLQEHGMDLDVDVRRQVPSRQSDMFGDDDSIFGDAMVGLADSEHLQTANEHRGQDSGDLEEFFDMDYDVGVKYDEPLYDESPTQVETEAPEQESISLPHECLTSSSVQVPVMSPEMGRSLFLNNTSDIVPVPETFEAPMVKSKGPALVELRPSEVMPPKQRKLSGESVKEKEPKIGFDFDDDENTFVDLAEPEELEKSEIEQKPVPDGFKDLESWLFASLGKSSNLLMNEENVCGTKRLPNVSRVGSM